MLKNVFILMLFCVFNNIYSQNIDSFAIKKDTFLKFNKNNSIYKFEERFDSTKKKKVSLVKNKIVDDKNLLFSKIDSNSRKDFLEKGRKGINSKVNPAKDNFKQSKTVFNKPKVLLKERFSGTKVLKFSGEIRLENYTTTAQNPMVRNEPTYSRLYISPTVSLFGLPFKGNVFLTTENNNTYKSDFFSFRFDVNAYRQMAAKQIQTQINEAKKIDRLRTIDIQKNILESNRYENELNQLKSQMPNIDELQKDLQLKAEQKSKAFIEEQEKNTKEKLKGASEEEKLKIENDLKYKKDSIISFHKKQLGDSIVQQKNNINGSVDSMQMAKFVKIQSLLDGLKLKKQKLEDLKQEDSAKVLGKINQFKNPNDLKTAAKEHLKTNKLMQQVLSVERFGIGIVNPQYSENTLFAVSVKGIDLGVKQKKYFYDITLGKIMPQFLGMFSDQAPKYTRNIGITRFGIGELSKEYLGMEIMHAFDGVNNENSLNPIRNTIFNLSSQFFIHKNTTIQSNIAHSQYKEKTNYPIFNSEKVSNQLKASMFQSYLLNIKHNIGENTKLEFNLKQTGLGFRTVGNPFLRKNFRELETKLEKLFFKKKIKIQASYKEMRDNLVEIGPSTNRLKGYGLKLSTSFDKYPNLTLNYSPYQQGNNHPDSLYKTNNQFSIISGIITYKKRYKRINWIGLLSYTRSAMEINGNGIVAYKMYNMMQTIQYGNRQTYTIAWMNNTTTPLVDSLNSNSYQISHSYLLTQKLTINSIGDLTYFKNNAFKVGGGFQISAILPNSVTISFLTKYERINRLWNLQNTNVYTGKLVLIWKW